MDKEIAKLKKELVEDLSDILGINYNKYKDITDAKRVLRYVDDDMKMKILFPKFNAYFDFVECELKNNVAPNMIFYDYIEHLNINKVYDKETLQDINKIVLFYLIQQYNDAIKYFFWKDEEKKFYLSLIKRLSTIASFNKDKEKPFIKIVEDFVMNYRLFSSDEDYIIMWRHHSSFEARTILFISDELGYYNDESLNQFFHIKEYEEEREIRNISIGKYFEKIIEQRRKSKE